MIFHRDAHGFPADFTPPRGQIALTHSPHAAARAEEKGFRIPKFVTVRRYQVIEITLFKGELIKMVIRGKYNDTQDIVMAIAMRDSVVKTAWLNDTTDQHVSLDISKYDKP